MIIVKILGILDIFTAVFFWIFAFFGIIPTNLIILLGVYLLIKGAVFLISRDVASIIDIVCSFVVFISLNFTIPKVISILVSLYLLQKGVFSLLS